METFDVLLFGVALSMPTVAGPLLLWAAGEPLMAVLLGSAAWFVIMGYESPLVPRWKREVRRRVR